MIRDQIELGIFDSDAEIPFKAEHLFEFACKYEKALEL